MAESTQTQNNSKNLDVQALLKQQNDKFEQKMQAQKEEMQAKLDDMAKLNNKLTEELNNLKTNTAQENALLGEQIAKIVPDNKLNCYNPFNPKLNYSVYNEEAQITTLMSGDEIECIIGLQEHITKKLINGEKEFKKFPYVVKLLNTK